MEKGNGENKWVTGKNKQVYIQYTTKDYMQASDSDANITLLFFYFFILSRDEKNSHRGPIFHILSTHFFSVHFPFFLLAPVVYFFARFPLSPRYRYPPIATRSGAGLFI